MKPSIILGIDTSCDDTGIGIVKDGQVLANVVASQTALHASFGGVMPEQASREHLKVIDEVLERALGEAGLELPQIQAIAATFGPGLIGTLLIGLCYGKSLAWSQGLPFIPIHHLEGHIASCLAEGDIQPPFLCLIASGGHTSLFEVSAWGHYKELGRSLDDAAGEAFDKVARLLGLGYPGGSALSKLAQQGDPKAFMFTRPLRQQKGFNFSFSGLKTAVATLVASLGDNLPKADIAASFEYTVVDALLHVCQKASKKRGINKLVIAGGVAANRLLREKALALPWQVYFPPLKLATDNGAMIALAAYKRLKLGEGVNNPWQIDARAYLPLEAITHESYPSI
ncbi:MAG: tRNA (adenosine(37)-N6)-threonylcarbamoyltransferase complex transferase subunit TsaD [Deinococcales bacterium]